MQVRLRVPATTANLGPGFDALGLALDLWNEAVFEANEAADDDAIEVTVEGEGRAVLPANGDNAIVQAAANVFQLAERPIRGFRLRCINRVPLGSGLGSSSAAMLTGMLGANAMLGNLFGAGFHHHDVAARTRHHNIQIAFFTLFV